MAPRVPPSRVLNAGAGRPCDTNRAVSAASSGKKNVNTRRPVVSRTAPDLSWRPGVEPVSLISLVPTWNRDIWLPPAMPMGGNAFSPSTSP